MKHPQSFEWQSRGFTLIELMLVIAILGLAAMYVVITSPTRAPGNTAEDAARKFLLQMHHVREQAILRNYVYGIEFDDDYYTFYRWREEAWHEIIAPPLVATRVSDTVEFEFELGDFRILDNMTEGRDAIFGRDARRESSDDDDPPRPQILVFESSEFIPFRVRFTGREPGDITILLDGRSGIDFVREERDVW